MPNDLGLNSACVTIAYMRRLAVSAAFVLAAMAGLGAADDPLARARLLYNQGQWEAAIAAAELARQTPARADAADLVGARAYLERFRASDSADDLVNARERLRRIDPQHFAATERAEYVVGLGEALFLDGSFGAAADVLDPIVRNEDVLAGDARERVLDWWASALDRDAKPRPEIDRQGVYQRIRSRMEDELSARPVSGTAAYWLAAAARAQRCAGRMGRGDRCLGARPSYIGPRRHTARRHRSARPARDRSRPREGHRADAGEPPSAVGAVQGALDQVAHAFASFQFSPTPTSTVSGTFIFAAPCMPSRTISENSSARAFGTSNSNSS